MVIACGSCGNCSNKLVYLTWKDDKVVIVVACRDCKVEMHFDLETMYAALISVDDPEQMLRDFVPKGRPN